mgnify:FL=1|jgi:hypothetical protein
MPAVKTQSKFLAKYGNKVGDAVKKVADKETRYGIIDLPPGINGVCRLVSAEFVELPADTKQKRADGKSAAGEYQFKAQAVLVEPKVFEGMHVAGQQVWLFEPFFDTKNKDGSKTTTQMEHIDEILNHMRKLGIDTKGADVSDLEEFAKALTEGKPYFKFSTSAGKATAAYPNPRVWQNWNGIIEDYQPEDASAEETVDNTGGGEADPDVPKEPDTDDTTTGSDDAVDLDELVRMASDNDTDAQERLTQMATEAGASEEDIGNAADWEAVRALIEPATDDGDGVEETVEEFVPVKGNVCNYSPPDPKDKTGKKRLKQANCKIESVNTKAKTADLKNLSSKALYKGVAWGELEAA